MTLINTTKHIAGEADRAYSWTDGKSFADLSKWEPEFDKLVTGKGIDVPNVFAITRSDSDQPIGVVGKKYQTLSNAGFCEFVAEYAEQTGGVIVDGGEFRNGSTVYATVQHGEEEIGKGSGDIVKPFTVFRNSHDGSSPFQGGGSTFRPTCQNALNAIMRRAEFASKQEGVDALWVSIPHFKSIGARVQAAKKVMTASMQHNARLMDVFRAMRDTRMSVKGMDKFLREVVYPISPKVDDACRQAGMQRHPSGNGWIIDMTGLDKAQKVKVRAEERRQERVGEVINLVQHGGGSEFHGSDNLWSLYNGLTEYVDHGMALRPNGRDEAEARMESSMWGTGAKEKQRVFNLITAQPPVQAALAQ